MLRADAAERGCVSETSRSKVPVSRAEETFARIDSITLLRLAFSTVAPRWSAIRDSCNSSFHQ